MPGNKIPANVVTMNSVIRVVDDAGAEQEWTLVYPEEANVASAKLSVLSPMGAALLGAVYPGMMAVRQDPIEALAHE